jgi:hypothetical protein
MGNKETLKSIIEQINEIEREIIDIEGAIFLSIERMRIHKIKLKTLRAWVTQFVKDNEPKETS